MKLGIIHLVIFALVGYFLIKPKIESFMGWGYGYSPYGYGGFGRRYYAGYGAGGRYFGRYGGYGGYNGYPYYRGYSGISRYAGYPRGWGGRGWFW